VRIGLVGSWKDEDAKDWNLSDKDGFVQASQALAIEIARRNHQIVVGSESDVQLTTMR
jgi:hypothetical protein